jgi:hypothetical protein
MAQVTKKGYALRKLQRGLSSIETCCKSSNIKINGHKNWFVYFSPRLRPPEVNLGLDERNTSVVNYVKHLPTNGISTLSWWWGLRAPETLRAMPAVA